MPEIPPDVIQAKPRVLAERIRFHDLNVRVNSAREEVRLYLAVLHFQNLAETPGEILAISHQREDRVPPFWRKPPLFHAPHKLDNRWFMDLGISLDQMRAPNALLLAVGSKSLREVEHHRRLRRSNAPALRQEIDDNAEGCEQAQFLVQLGLGWFPERHEVNAA